MGKEKESTVDRERIVFENLGRRKTFQTVQRGRRSSDSAEHFSDECSRVGSVWFGSVPVGRGGEFK